MTGDQGVDLRSPVISTPSSRSFVSLPIVSIARVCSSVTVSRTMTATPVPSPIKSPSLAPPKAVKQKRFGALKGLQSNKTNKPNKPKGPQLFSHDTRTGWIFLAPFAIGLITFIVLPIFMALWVSFTDWSGITPPLKAKSIGLSNYKTLLVTDGLRRNDFALSLRNNFYYVILVVPIQTFLAFILAFIVHQKVLRGKSFFRLAFFFPSITSSIAVSLIFKFIFQVDGLANKVFPGKPVNWFGNSRGTFHNLFGVFGVKGTPSFLKGQFFGQSLWDWLSGPSVAMSAIMACVIWTTSGTLMLIFLGGLQNIPESLDEAATLDGATGWKRMWHVTFPMVRPQVFLVLILGLVGTWQVFDQVYAMSFGGPDKSTITPAFWIYYQSFRNGNAGFGAAMAVALCAIISVFTYIQRRLVSDKGVEA
jgi:multiple sugar transport system permease protein